MIDLRLLREDPDRVRASQRVRNEDPALVDSALEADSRRRAAVLAADNLRAEHNALSKSVGRAIPERRPALVVKAGVLAAKVKVAEATQSNAEQAFFEIVRRIGNLVEDGVPIGGEDDFVVIDHIGSIPNIATPRDHLELAETLGLVDMERGAKVAGSRFYFMTHYGALFQLALLNLAVRTAVANGFKMMIPPVIVKPEIMEGTGFLGSHADEVYRLENDNTYLVGTSEVPLAGYHAGEIIDLSGGPLRYAAQSTCFRREAGSYGKDTRGIFRVHQFEKVEMFSYCKPEDAVSEHQRLLGFEQDMLNLVDVPYRIIDVAAGDLGASAARKYDCEAWVPSQQRFRELTSTSNCTSFQARRLGVRYRDDEGRAQYAATVNGTLATVRWLVAIWENNQLPNGGVRVPAAMQEIVGLEEIHPD